MTLAQVNGPRTGWRSGFRTRDSSLPRRLVRRSRQAKVEARSAKAGGFRLQAEETAVAQAFRPASGDDGREISAPLFLRECEFSFCGFAALRP